MWGWIKPILEVLLDWLVKKSKEPKELEDANTPKTLRNRWDEYIRGKLRNKQDGCN